MNDHQMIYENINVLTNFYEPSKELKYVLQNDMFAKKNKAAFHQVVYYLFNVLDPNETKKKISWPIYDVKSESKFRTEVQQYIVEINEKYPHADILVLPASQLISPGGSKFVHFLLKLSQLVVFEHLQRKGVENLLYCPKMAENAVENEKNVARLNKCTKVIKAEVAKKERSYLEFKEKCKAKAQEILEALSKNDEELKELRGAYNTKRDEFQQNQSDFLPAEQLEELYNFLKSQCETVKPFKTLILDVKALLDYADGNLPFLTYDKLQLPQWNEVAHLKHTSELSLTDVLFTLNTILERKALEFPNPTDEFIKEIEEKVNELKEKYVFIGSTNKKILENVNKLNEDLSEAKENIIGLHDQLK